MRLPRTNAILPLVAASDLTGMVGRFVIRTGDTVALATDPAAKPFGVLLTDGPAGQPVSVAVSSGGLAGTVRVKLGATVSASGSFLQLGPDGCAIPENPADPARCVCAVALETGAINELIEAVIFNPTKFPLVPPVLATAPALTGAATLGDAVSCSAGVFNSLPAPSNYSYQWQRYDGGSWLNIDGATASTYVLSDDDLGKTVRCGVVATNIFGDSAIAYSAATTEVVTPPVDLTVGCLAFWKLDDLTDASGNGNHLTNNNAATFAAGMVGDAAFLDSSELSYLSSPSPFPIAGASPWTVSVFVKDLTAGSGGHILSFGDAGGGTAFGLFLWPASSSDGLQGFGVTQYGLGEVMVNGIAADTWYHCIVTWDGSSLKVYSNNVLVLDLDWAGQMNIAEGPLQIGKWLIHDDGITAGVDAAGVWNRVLNPFERAALYNAGAGFEPTFT